MKQTIAKTWRGSSGIDLGEIVSGSSIVIPQTEIVVDGQSIVVIADEVALTAHPDHGKSIAGFLVREKVLPAEALLLVDEVPLVEGGRTYQFTDEQPYEFLHQLFFCTVPAGVDVPADLEVTVFSVEPTHTLELTPEEVL